MMPCAVLAETGQRRLSEAKENAQGLQSDVASLSAERDRLLQERDATMARLREAQSKLQSKETDIAGLASKLESTQKRLLMLDEANAVLNEDNVNLVSCPICRGSSSWCSSRPAACLLDWLRRARASRVLNHPFS